MKNFFKNYITAFKNKSLIKKTLYFFLLLIYIFIVVICSVKVNYDVLTPGVANKVSSFIKVDSDNEVGQIYTVAVYSDTKVPLIRYWLAKIDDRLHTYKRTTTLSVKQEYVQGQISKDLSINNAIITAYTEASLHNSDISIDYEYLGAIVYTIDLTADQTIKLGDTITKVNGQTTSSLSDFSNKVSDYLNNPTNDSIELTILRDDNEITINPKLQNVSGKYKIGITTYPKYKINSTTPSYTVETTDTGGPSGGLMQTIAVYNAITTEDITNGQIILGTGEISLTGQVGEIGGITQKIITANMYKNVSVFFTPYANYNDAYKQWQKLKKPSFVVVPVASFSDAIDYLRNPNPEKYLEKVGE